MDGLAPSFLLLALLSLLLLLTEIRWRIHCTRKSQPFLPCTTDCNMVVPVVEVMVMVVMLIVVVVVVVVVTVVVRW